jgi:SAM-dependent methyltransferase
VNDFKDHFSSHAAAYATYRPGYPPELAAWMASVVPTRARALDVGAGSGQLSVLLAEHFAEVVATEPSAQQLESAARHPKVDYRVAPAELCDLPDASVDLLTAAQAAHWFDLPAFFAEARRILKPQGAIVVISYAGMEHSSPVEPLIDAFRLETLKLYWPAERQLVENGYRDIDLPFEPIAAPPFFIEVEWPLAAMIGYLDTWSAIRAMERDQGRGMFDSFLAELTKTWGDPQLIRRIRWPLAILAGRN